MCDFTNGIKIVYAALCIYVCINATTSVMCSRNNWESFFRYINTKLFAALSDCWESRFNPLFILLDWEKYVKFDPRYLRPTEVDDLIGDASKAREVLGWQASVLPPELVGIMVDADIAAAGASA